MKKEGRKDRPSLMQGEAKAPLNFQHTVNHLAYHIMLFPPGMATFRVFDYSKDFTLNLYFLYKTLSFQFNILQLAPKLLTCHQTR